jgi:hypothetical protein
MKFIHDTDLESDDRADAHRAWQDDGKLRGFDRDADDYREVPDRLTG